MGKAEAEDRKRGIRDDYIGSIYHEVRNLTFKHPRLFLVFTTLLV